MAGFGPGGPTDIVARLIAQWLSERLRQPFIVENRPGAGTNIATETVVRAPPDGYTLLQVTVSNTINATLYNRLNFNFIRDIVPIASIARTFNVMEISPSVPVKSLPEFIAYAKANPGKLNMAAVGVGSATRLYGELFKSMAGVDLVTVQYTNPGPALIDLIGGKVEIMFDSILSSLEHIRSGKLRALAVTSASRSELLPGVPTMREFVPGYEASGVFGLGAPKRTPVEIVDRLNKEVNAALIDPKIKERLAALGAAVFPSTDFSNFIAEDTDKWAKVIRAANIKAE
ncbi:MAG TPA: tripartite tricarboxylate transporter substrate binding protein [Xanthobacteraceae bacterium]